jgi:hypothetical protein
MKSHPLSKEESQKLDRSSIPHPHFKHILGGFPSLQALKTINYYYYYYYYSTTITLLFSSSFFSYDELSLLNAVCYLSCIHSVASYVASSKSTD